MRILSTAFILLISFSLTSCIEDQDIKRERFEQRFEKKMSVLKTKMQSLNKLTASKSNQVRKTLEEKYYILKGKEELLEAHLKDMQNYNHNRWDQAKNKAEQMATNIETQIDRLLEG